VYDHGNFAAQLEMIRDLYDIQPGEIDLPTFPLFALFDPALGMTTIVPEMDPTRPAEVDPRKIIDAVKDFGVTNMFGSPGSARPPCSRKSDATERSTESRSPHCAV